MFYYWAVEAVGDDAANAGETHHLGVFIARSENEAAHVALFQMPFDEGGEWRIVGRRVETPVAYQLDA
ncbi:hypothetical protein LCGC14_1158620 [marine sediment metagenome]|uniref:Uncharacterized protein n=1 Tax=marine sediment metagenome TaxID=412755 RepID=A0A0F9LTB1_9ZZZZ